MINTMHKLIARSGRTKQRTPVTTRLPLTSDHTGHTYASDEPCPILEVSRQGGISHSVPVVLPVALS